MSATRRLRRSVSRSTALRTAVALTATAGLTGAALVAPAAADVPASLARVAAAPFTGTQDAASSPVTVDVTYELDGKKVTAEQVVGRTGLLEISYLVRNRTTQPTELRYKDGKGEEVVETVDLVAPYVGRLAVALPARAGDVQAEGAEVLQDSLAWSLVLFNPLGEPAQKLRLSMRVTDAELPQAQLQVAKVSPTDGGVLAKGIAAAEESSGGSTRLTEGVFKIDSSVLKLRDGASELFDGLVQLAGGSAALEEGLAGKAAPGAKKLSDGLGQAREGGAKLDDGVGQLADGSVKLGAGLSAANTGGKALAEGLDKLSAGGGRLVAGLDSAAAGGGKLAEGLRSTSGQPDLTGGAQQIAAGLLGLQGGLTKLNDGIAALPQNPGVLQLKDTLTQVQAGIGQYTDVATPTTTNPTLLGALNALKYGMRNPAGLSALECSTTPGTPTSCGIGDIAERVSLGLSQAAGSSNQGLIDLIADSKNAYFAADCPDVGAASPVTGIAPPTTPGLTAVCALTAKVAWGLAVPPNVIEPGHPGGVLAQTEASKANLGVAAQGLEAAYKGVDVSVVPTLTKVQGGLSNPAWDVNKNGRVDDGEKPGVKEVQALLSAGVTALVDGVVANVTTALGTPTSDPKTTLRGGAAALGAGAGTLAEKTALAADGALQLSGGLDQLAAGGGQLSDGADAASAGSKKLSGGLDQLAAGGGRLVAGLDAASAGTGKLLDGLGQLDDGAAQLASGLGDAAEGSGKLADGIVKVKDGVEKVRDGSGELSGRGTAALGGSVNTAARANAQKVAMLQAIGEMSADSSPSFDIVLAGSAAEESGMSTPAVVGAAAALALLTMAAAGAVVARRRNVI